MQMNPKYYYDNFVKPNYDEFCADEGSIRKFYLNNLSTKEGTLSYFNDVQSTANAYKYLYTNSGI
ncbi:MAG TPA: hypothetical protein DCE80_06340 [Ignavibacteriales bacterium]|nr:hypothetical protein [Ignavibacteriales bacterium]